MIRRITPVEFPSIQFIFLKSIVIVECQSKEKDALFRGLLFAVLSPIPSNDQLREKDSRNKNRPST